MNYKVFSPNPILSHYIKFFYFFENPDPAEKMLFERITPDGCFELNFNLGGPIQRLENNGNTFVQNNNYLTSRFTNSYFVRKKTSAKMVGINFYPWGLRPFIKIKANDLIDKYCSMEEIFDSKINQLREQIEDSVTPEMAIMFIEDFFISELISQNSLDVIVADACRKISSKKGNIDLESLFSSYNISQRRIQQRFLDVVGISPKMFTKMVKFQYALKQIKQNGTNVNFTEIAINSGYFDQAHFIKNFKSFSGISPAKYLKEIHPFNDLMVNLSFAD